MARDLRAHGGAFLGLPQEDSGAPCRTCIVDVGAAEVRVGADIADLRTPVVVPTAPSATTPRRASCPAARGPPRSSPR